MIIGDVIRFLRDTPPFQILNERDLVRVASTISVRFFPRNTFISKHDEPPSNKLVIIKKGGVKIFHRSDADDEALTEYFGEGGVIDLSLPFGSDRAGIDAITVEDTICYLIRKEAIQDILNRHETITDFLHKSFVSNYLDRRMKEIRDGRLMTGGGDKLLFAITVGELTTNPVITAPPDISIQEAAEIMDRHRISSLILSEDSTAPVGIVTDRDMRTKVVARNRDTAEQVRAIMNTSLIKSDARECCIEALLKMIRFNIRHLLVVDNGKLKGILTTDDLMMLHGSTPLSLAREIEIQHTVGGLARAARRINDTVALLIREGVRASTIVNITSEIGDRLVKKLLEIAERRFGPSPLSYCWLATGSDGRREYIFGTERSNAIIYADPFSPAEEEKAKSFFAEFTTFVNESIAKCMHFDSRPGNMSSKQVVCLPLQGWKRFFVDRISDANADAAIYSTPFFDFRPVYGDIDLAFDLRSFLLSAIRGEPSFLGLFANTLVQKSYSADKDIAHSGEASLDGEDGEFLVGMVRLFALENGIKEISTAERIERLRKMHTAVSEYVDDLGQAFEFITLINIHRGFELMEAVKRPVFRSGLSKPDNTQRKIAREYFHLILKLRKLLIGRSRGSFA